jgi:hypothetical protein
MLPGSATCALQTPGTHPPIFHDEVDQALYLRGELAFLIFGEEGNLYLELFNRVRQPTSPWMNFPSG